MAIKKRQTGSKVAAQSQIASRKSKIPRQPVAQLLTAVPRKNAAVRVEPAGEGLLVTVPINRPRWLAPPISWLLPFSRQRQVRLDGPGRRVVELCDGTRTVEEVIESFAKEHKLSFREGQVAVTQFLRDLLQRGIIVLVGA